jgi:hypothetical protein
MEVIKADSARGDQEEEEESLALLQGKLQQLCVPQSTLETALLPPVMSVPPKPAKPSCHQIHQPRHPSCA